jgi:hypothetical protein
MCFNIAPTESEKLFSQPFKAAHESKREQRYGWGSSFSTFKANTDTSATSTPKPYEYFYEDTRSRHRPSH